MPLLLPIHANKYIRLTIQVQSIPRIIPRAEHNISRRYIDQDVLDILYTLSKHAFEAYLVGGCVRDLWMGLEPKDFDIVTNATPEQIKKVFRGRCRLIGRRFRLAHIYTGNQQVIEVATFRAEDKENGDRVVDAQGMLRRDNVYGSRDEDVWRRDFTMNALLYDVRDYSIIDYVGGIDDLTNGHIRLIGEPEQRYREDPVRMIRAVRFACKLGLTLPTETAAPMPQLAHLLAETSPARLFEEVLKLFHGGQGVCVFEQLRHHGLMEGLFEQTEYCLSQADSWSGEVIPAALHQTDVRIEQGKSVHPGFLYAVMLWEPLWQAMDRDEQEQVSLDDLLKAANLVLFEQNERTAISRPVMAFIKEVWAMQLVLVFHQQAAQSIMAIPRFRAGFDFLSFRAIAIPRLKTFVDYWQQQQDAHPEWVYNPTWEVFDDADETSSRDESSDQEGYKKKKKRPYRRRR